jgi:hypothetical protein
MVPGAVFTTFQFFRNLRRLRMCPKNKYLIRQGLNLQHFNFFLINEWVQYVRVFVLCKPFKPTPILEHLGPVL